MKLDIAVAIAPFAVWDSLARAGLARREVDGFSIIPDETRAERRRQLAADRQRGGHRDRKTHSVRDHSGVGSSTDAADVAAAPSGARGALERGDGEATRTSVDHGAPPYVLAGVDRLVAEAPTARGAPHEGGGPVHSPSESPCKVPDTTTACQTETTGAPAGVAAGAAEGGIDDDEGDMGARAWCADRAGSGQGDSWSRQPEGAPQSPQGNEPLERRALPNAAPAKLVGQGEPAGGARGLPRAEASSEAPATQGASGGGGPGPRTAEPTACRGDREPGARGEVRSGDGREAESDPWALSGDVPVGGACPMPGRIASDDPQAGPVGQGAGGGAPIQQRAAADTGEPAATFALSLSPAAPRRTRAEISAAAQQKREREAREKAGRAAQREAKKRAPKPKPAGVEYAEEYATGQRVASGCDFAVPTAVAVFWPILRAHARGSDGTPLEGQPLRTWIRDSSAEYRRAMAESPFEKGYSPQKWGEWLQGGKKPYRGRGGAGRFMQNVADVQRNGALPNMSEQLAAAGDI